jgi:AsmA family protein
MKFKQLLIALLVAGLLPLLILALINTPPGRSALSSAVSNWTQRDVRFSGLIHPVSVWPPALRVKQLAVANMENGRAPYMAQIGTMTVAWERRGLWRGKWRIRQLALIDSRINLERDAQGKANWQLSAERDPQDELPPIGNLYLENSIVSYFDVLQKTDIVLQAVTENERFTFEGEGKHLGRSFSAKGEAAAMCLVNQQGQCPLELTLTVGDTFLYAKGTLNELVPPEGANFILDIKGADAAELFPLFGIALPSTPPYRLSGRLTYENDRWHFNDFTGAMGDSDLHGEALWDRSQERPQLRAELFSDTLRFIDLGPLIGLAPEKPQSQAQKELAVRQRASAFAIPDIPLDITRLTAMDAEVEFTGKKVISEHIPLDDFYMKLSLDQSLMKLIPVRFGTARGDILANVVIDARQLPVHNRADIYFSHLKLAGLLQGLSKSIPNMEEPEGEIGGIMKLSGPGQSLREMFGHAKGVAGIGMEGGSVSNLLIKLLSLDIARSLGFLLTGDKPLAIRCVVASFDIDQGIMTTDSFVIDTADTNIMGTGTVNLKSEELDLRVVPAPKVASLLSLRSPIDIRGTIKHPRVVIEKGPLATRGGVATALSTVAPLAAILALVDPGMGKDSDCPALISRMNAKTGETSRTNEVPKNPQ